MGEITVDTIDEVVRCPDPISEKIVSLVAKYNALDECMAAVKKGYEKDVINRKPAKPLENKANPAILGCR